MKNLLLALGALAIAERLTRRIPTTVGFASDFVASQPRGLWVQLPADA